MERSSKRGKIPQQDWPSIIKRYEAGETLASIARTYDCSPPAISYIVSRSRAREATAEGAPELPELTLVSAQVGETSAALVSPNVRSPDEKPENRVGPETLEPVPPLPVQPQPIKDEQPSLSVGRGPDPRRDVESHNGNGAANRLSQPSPDGSAARNELPDGSDPANISQGSGERRTLHLPLSHDGALRAEAEIHDNPGRSSSIEERYAAPPAGDPKPGPAEYQTRDRRAYDPGANGGPFRKIAEPHARDIGTFIDQALRQRVDGDIAAFLAAFDAALAQDTPENRAGLREATDRLLRAGARTRIELERLEARVPLPPRDAARHAPPAWRPR
jgi:hypothetical protein